LGPQQQIEIKLASLRPGAAATLIGLREAQLCALLPSMSLNFHVLRLDLDGPATIASAIDRTLDDLADLAASLWPNWMDRSSPSNDALGLLANWRDAAIRFASTGRRPRFPRLAREIELAHLLSVLPGLVLLVQIDSFQREKAASTILAIDWCRRHGATVVTLLADEPANDAPWDLVLYDAIRIEALPIEPAAHRLIPALPIVSSSGSVTERRMREALKATPDLAGLFEDEITIQLGPLGPTPRVDLLWREGKVVVELDGPEHERDPDYGADRHRDYELLVAGYLVLRLTNAEVQLDLSRSMEKVRRVVNLRRRIS
jgi:Protein of unknown function (DUF559)